ncbi:hypothetical protein [Pseudemcibacter aquimaris]|uniref:hypothetical protein n=1 Tax=Pseudemcibacter aquimaris TaxID=2857064 RepID=UPI002011D22C|nr:hypothetical protein [Pseudemcibacter aquimaris]MCC3860388.1 hypothetical protein [Pseudemcibacter aquimaris]WDU57714.1 hypothetical protein KW060_10955 [Pseudemcibacter aquimaris]
MSVELNEKLRTSINDIEAGYEFLLAYAAQGRDVEYTGGGTVSIRDYLTQMQSGLASVADDFEAIIDDLAKESAPLYREYIDVLRADAKKSKMAVDIVLSLPSIGSQVVDNLNATIHIRALLTDIFLLDEALTSLSRAMKC